MKVGTVHPTNNCGQLVVIKYTGCYSVQVRFIGSGYTTFARTGDIRKGKVKDPFYKRTYGIGYLGDATSNREGKEKKSYKVWHFMMQRCYENSGRQPSYFNKVSVCEEWHCFATYEKWYEGHYVIGFHVDKDLTVLGNKEYSPVTCAFIPQKLNNLITSPTEGRHLPLGTYLIKGRGKYAAECNDKEGNKIYLGSYNSPEEAFLAYKPFKEETIKQVAEDSFSKGEISTTIYNNLMNYVVEPY